MKINFKGIGSGIVKFGKRAAPAASIALGVTCTAVAAYKTAKALPIAKEHIIAKEVELDKPRLTIKETVQACGRDFVEPIAFGVVGISAIGAGVFDYEHTIKNLGTSASVASALLQEQAKEMTAALGESKSADIQNKAVTTVAQTMPSAGARVVTPGGSDIFIEEVTGREYLSSEAWIRESFSKYMDDFIDNPDDRPPLSNFYDILAPNVRQAGAPIGAYLTFPYDIDKPGKYSRVDLTFVPAETVDGRAAFMWRYSRPLEYLHAC